MLAASRSGSWVGAAFRGRPIPSARVRAYLVTRELVASVLQGVQHPYTTDLPADAVATGVWYDPWRGCFYVQFHSESFEPIPEGYDVPEGSLTITYASPTERTA